MIITAYSIKSGFANVANAISLRRPSDSNVIYDELHLVLPDCYTVEDTVSGPCVFDPAGASCELCYNNRRQTAIIAVSSNGMVGVKRSVEGQTSITLRDARLAANLTQRQLADLSGVNIRQIQRVELGEADPGNLTAKNLLAIADALNINAHDLINHERVGET